MQSRRVFLGAMAGSLAAGGAGAVSRAGAEPPDGLAPRNPPDFRVLDLEVDGDKKLANRFTLFIPNHLAKDERVPLLVLLHGLGETWDTGIGVYAWVERYGLGTAYGRLRRPPIVKAWQRGNLFTDAHLAEINASLVTQPFRGMAIACPFTPNIVKQPNPDAALDAYAAWIADVVIPRARKEAPVIPDAAHTGLDGVSLGGYVGVEIFARRPDAFGVWGGVQGAYNVGRLPFYVDRIAAAVSKATKPSVHIQTSESDVFRATNVGLHEALEKKGVAHDFVMLPGLHDQVFLREAGSIEMLLWHDRRLR